MKPLSAILTLTAVCAAISCSTADKKAVPDTKGIITTPEGPQLIGRIASVPAEKTFVLVQRYGKWEPTAGEILTTRGPEERTANLRLTGESLGEFAAADIQSGTLELGDGVYARHTVKSPAPATPPAITPEMPAAAEPAIPKNN